MTVRPVRRADAADRPPAAAGGQARAFGIGDDGGGVDGSGVGGGVSVGNVGSLGEGNVGYWGWGASGSSGVGAVGSSGKVGSLMVVLSRGSIVRRVAASLTPVDRVARPV